MNGVGHPPSSGSVHGVAGLVRPFPNPASLPAILEHLRHEGQLVELPLLIQGRQYLLFAPDFRPITAAEVKFSGRFVHVCLSVLSDSRRASTPRSQYLSGIPRITNWLR